MNKDLEKPFWQSKVYWFAIFATVLQAGYVVMTWAISVSDGALDSIAKDGMENLGWAWGVALGGKAVLDAVGVRPGKAEAA